MNKKNILKLKCISHIQNCYIEDLQRNNPNSDYMSVIDFYNKEYVKYINLKFETSLEYVSTYISKNYAEEEDSIYVISNETDKNKNFNNSLNYLFFTNFSNYWLKNKLEFSKIPINKKPPEILFYKKESYKFLNRIVIDPVFVKNNLFHFKALEYECFQYSYKLLGANISLLDTIKKIYPNYTLLINLNNCNKKGIPNLLIKNSIYYISGLLDNRFDLCKHPYGYNYRLRIISENSIIKKVKSFLRINDSEFELLLEYVKNNKYNLDKKLYPYFKKNYFPRWKIEAKKAIKQFNLNFPKKEKRNG